MTFYFMSLIQELKKITCDFLSFKIFDHTFYYVCGSRNQNKCEICTHIFC